MPNSIHIRKERGQYSISFCYEKAEEILKLPSQADHFKFLQGASTDYLQENTIGVDRGVAIPVHAGSQTFDFSRAQKKKIRGRFKSVAWKLVALSCE